MDSEPVNFGRIALDKKKIERADTILGWIDETRVILFKVLTALGQDRFRANTIGEIQRNEGLAKEIEDLLEKTGGRGVRG